MIDWLFLFALHVPNTYLNCNISTSAPKKKKSGPLGVKGATRAFNVIKDNDMAPEEVISIVKNELNDVEMVASTLAKYLWEPKLGVLRKCLRVFSRERLVAWLEETIRTESDSGMQTLAGERRKSPGGVFFALIGRDATEEERAQSVGFPRAQFAARHPDRASSKSQTPHLIPRAKKQINVQYTPIEEPGSAPSELAASKAKRNPFALNPPASLASPIFSASEDLGEPVTM